MKAYCVQSSLTKNCHVNFFDARGGAHIPIPLMLCPLMKQLIFICFKEVDKGEKGILALNILFQEKDSIS